jgi:hypothetical protein
MTLAADFGLWLLASYPVGTTVSFKSVLLPDIGRTGPSSFCTTVNLAFDVQYALTLDYDTEMLRHLLTLLPRSVTKRISPALTSPFTEPGIVEIGQPFHAAVTARLGEPIHAAQEIYAPLQVLTLERPAARDDVFSFSVDPTPAEKQRPASQRRVPSGSSDRDLEIALPDVLYVLETDRRILLPAPTEADWPWIVSATAAALRAHSFGRGESGVRLALLANDRPHVQGLSSWLAIVGPGAMTILEEVRTRLESNQAPAYIESADPHGCALRPFLVQDGERCALLTSNGGDDLVTEWNLGLIEDGDSMDTMAGLEAMAKAVEGRLSRSGLSTRSYRWDGNQFSISGLAG